MEQNKFTVDQVQDFVENGLDLDLKWEERLVYNPSAKRYTQAKMEHFDNNKTAYMRLKNTKNNKTYLAKAKVSNTSFVISLNSSTIDASEQWVEEVMSAVRVGAKR